MVDVNYSGAKCPIGSETLSAMISWGYGELAMGLTNLCENGVGPGQRFGRKELIACGLNPEAVKTILNQCEGRDYDKRKNRQSPGSDRRVLPAKQAEEIKIILSALEEESKDTDYNYLKKEEQKYIINMIRNDLYEDPDGTLFIQRCQTSRKGQSPAPDAVKAVFSASLHSEEAISFEIPTPEKKRERGRPGRFFVMPTPEMLAKLFFVQTPDSQQDHFELYGHKTLESFRAAFQFQWWQAKGSGQYSLSDLSQIQGDSYKTVRAINERIGIQTSPNYRLLKINHLQLHGLINNCRGGCWLLLEPAPGLFSQNNSIEKILHVRRYTVTSLGLIKALRDWRRNQYLERFTKHLWLLIRLANSYEVPELFTLSINKKEELPGIEVLNDIESEFPF